jgi:hypothetical protein
MGLFCLPQTRIPARGGSTRPKGSRTKTTKRPTTSPDRCPFNFTLYFSHTLKRWYFVRLGGGNCGHKGHCQLRPDQVQVRSSAVGSDNLELIIQQLKHNIPVACIQALLRERTDTVLTHGQINALRLNDSVTGESVVGPGDTPAERLLCHLYSTEGVTFIALTGEKDESGLITFRQTRKTRRNQITETSEVVDDMVNSVDDDGPETFAERLISAMSLDHGQRILLAVAWVTEEAKRYFRMFPEACGVDVTNGTNSEKRPNGRGTLLTSNNRNIPFWNAYMPSESGWVWNWMFIRAFPALLPKSGLDEMNLMITDEDPQCYQQIGAAKQASALPKVHHRLCCWHKVNRNYILKARAHAVCDNDKQFTRVIEKWLYSFMNTAIESQQEECYSMEAFDHFLSQSQVAPALKLFTREYWVKVRAFCKSIVYLSFHCFDIWRFRHLDVSIFGRFN